MDIDRQLEEASARLTGAIAKEPIPATPSEGTERTKRPRQGGVLAVAALALGIIGLFVVVNQTDEPQVPAASSTTTTVAAERVRSYIDFNTGLTVDYPVSWHRGSQYAIEPVIPFDPSGDETEILALGSTELESGASQACPDLPVAAMSALGVDDALMIVTADLVPHHGTPWPDTWSPEAFGPEGDISTVVQDCTDRFDLVAYRNRFVVGGESGRVLIVTTNTGSDTTLDQLWAALDSIEFIPVPEPDSVRAQPEWTLEYLGDWYRADSELMPSLGFDSVTVATFPLVSGSEGRCAHMPSRALAELGPDDTLVTFFFNAGEGQPWPAEGFDDSVFPATGRTDAHECADRPDLEIHWGPWSTGSSGLYLLVAFGEDVDEGLRAETWAIASSLTPVRTEGGACVTTLPAEPDWVPPDGWPASPSDPASRWFGTPDLWTSLPVDGLFVERKSIWWSQHYMDSGVNPNPDINVRMTQLDGDGVVFSEGGTNGTTRTDGLFMIAHAPLEPPSPGCWQISAEFEGHTLTYVVHVP